ncbi:hypothetical protein [Cupriavidus sp. D384]|uniref:hypothetical protein n=1 Tax=Cupriavidus sp. D384 TaxID=1538095 RepID=UPI0027D8BF9D|nr:hypothetical protein [Cupriavidus sp. D384]
MHARRRLEGDNAARSVDVCVSRPDRLDLYMAGEEVGRSGSRSLRPSRDDLLAFRLFAAKRRLRDGGGSHKQLWELP